MENLFKIKQIKCTEDDLKKIGFDKTYTKKGLEKHKFITIKIYSLSCAQANILKQTALSSGTDCAVHRETITGKIESSDCILSGNLSEFKKIIEKLKFQPLKLSQLSQEIKKVIFENELENTIIRENIINWQDRPYLMGILNITPDSFSDGGKYLDPESAINQYKSLIENGADFIDIGGESTRPFAKKISVEEEINRVIPVIKAIREFDNKTIISIDTRNSKTADIALSEGADIVNDISSGDWDETMFDIVKKHNCPIVLNHSKGSPDIMQKNTEYEDVVDEIYDYFSQKIDELLNLGINKTNIIIDPGIGFGKNTAQNYEIIDRIEEFQALGYPILIGHSRKSFIKERINTENIEDLDIATAAITAKLIEKKVNILRVHNIKTNKIVLRLNNF